MTKKEIEIIKQHCRALETWIVVLQIRLLLCAIVIKFPRIKCNFPPSTMELETFTILMMNITQKSDEEINDIEIKINSNDQIEFGDVLKICSRINIKDPVSFYKSIDCLHYMKESVRYFDTNNNSSDTTINLITLYELLNRVTQISYELIGYWTVKVEEKRRNIKKADVKTDKKIFMKDVILRSMLKNNKDVASRDLIIRAMKIFKRSERTIRNWIEEIRKEKIV